MRKAVVLLLIVVLPVLGALAGKRAAPVFARAHYAVHLADQVRLEAADSDVETTLESDAFRAQGREREDLFAEAAAVEREFVLGTTVFGAWCGLVFALRILGLNRTRRREIYEINYDSCLSCGRCFLSCPRERLRLDELKGRRPAREP